MPMSRLAQIFLLSSSILLLIFTVIGKHGLLHLSQINNELEITEAKNRKIESDIASLRAEVRDLRSNPAALEQVAREELGMSKPGEIVYIFPKK